MLGRRESGSCGSGLGYVSGSLLVLYCAGIYFNGSGTFSRRTVLHGIGLLDEWYIYSTYFWLLKDKNFKMFSTCQFTES